MDDYFRTLYAFNRNFCEQLLADIADDEMLVQPAANVNTPAWLLGHLAICTDFALGTLGQEKQLPRDWMVYFGPGSKPIPGDRTWPDRQAMWDAYVSGHDLVAAASRDADPTLLAAPNPVEFLVSAMPTAGDLLAHLMTTHECFHLGHLSNWRRQTGRAPLF
ncbi:MAG: DinB family protein [Planctomycetota bacterium]